MGDFFTIGAVSMGEFLFCIAAALLLGALLAGSYMIKSKYTKSFVMTLALLPAIVSVVIMMVNGSIGAGVAVAGTFSLVRFRSAPGTAREILAVFLAMGIGLVIGMGYIGYAIVFAVVMCAMLVICNFISIKMSASDSENRVLKITIPEDLDYTEAFSDIFEQFTASHELIRVKTTNMGSMFRLTYNIKMISPSDEKRLIDALRVRNGNLEILISKSEMNASEL